MTKRLHIPFWQIASVIVTLALLSSGCATNTQPKASMTTQPKVAKPATPEGKIPLSGFTTKHIIRDGEAKGPQTMVMQGYSGSTLAPHSELSRSTEGRPQSGTIAIAESAPASDALILISLDNSALVGSRFEGTKLVVEVDARDGSMLLGEGATFLIRPGIERLRLGQFFVSTSNAKDWSSVEIARPSSQPKLTGMGIRIWQVPSN